MYEDVVWTLLHVACLLKVVVMTDNLVEVADAGIAASCTMTPSGISQYMLIAETEDSTI